MIGKETRSLLGHRGGMRAARALNEEGSALSAYLGLATTMMGACILALPGCLQALGILPGLALFAVVAWVTVLAFEMLCVSCDATGEYSYESLSSRLFGAAGVWVTRIFTVILLFGAIVLYMVIAMDLFQPFVEGIITRNTIGLIFTAIAIPLCLPETIHELRFVNLGVVVCVIYIVLAIAFRAIKNDPELVDKTNAPSTTDELTFSSRLSAFSYALPIVVLSFCCHLNIPRAYLEIHDKQSMKKVNWALCISGLIFYSIFALLGYVCFHGNPPSDILTGFPSDDKLINAARICLGATMILKTPMTFQPLRQVIQLCAMGHNRQSLKFRTILTCIFMVLAYFIATASHDLGIVMSFIGAITGNILSISVPGMFLYEIGHGYLYENRSYYNRQQALAMVFIGIVFSILSLCYLAYDAIKES